MVWHVNGIFEPELAYFDDKYLSTERMNKTKYVLGIYNAKCYKLLMRSVFVVLLVNDINELELSFWIILLTQGWAVKRRSHFETIIKLDLLTL